MKRNIKKRMIALTLCMVMLLSGSPSVLAQDTASKDVAAQATTNQDSAVAAAAEAPAEEAQPAAEGPTAPETPAAPEATTPEAPTAPEATTPEAPTAPEATTPEAPTAPTAPEAAAPEAPTTPEATTPDAPTADTPAPEQPVLVQEAMELKQEIKDADGKVICTVTANIPAETFTANTSDVTMEVKGVEENTAKEIKALMEKELTEEQILGEYFFYQIAFKVKGETAEPGHEIQITVEQNNFKITDTKKATVFYYNEAHSVEENEKAEIIEIAQKTELLEALKEAGESTENIDEYDLSEISLKADGTADKIQMEGRRSTVYGCYLTEKKPEEVVTEEPKKDEPKEEEPKKEEPKKEETKPAEELKFENDSVTVTVSADKKGIIPDDAKLQVVPILSDDTKTKEQYKEVEEQLNKKAENEDYEIAGFLAYDISFIDKDGKKVEPSGDVKVSIDYKKEAIPEEVKDTENVDTTIMHLEEDEKGEVKEVVDMVADEKQEATVETTKDEEVTKAEFKTNSFSSFVIIWQGSKAYFNITIHHVDEKGADISGEDGKKIISVSQNPKENPVVLSNYIEEFEGYSSSPQIRINAMNGSEVKRLQYSSETSYYQKTRYLKYSEKEFGNDWHAWKSRQYGGNTVFGDIYFIYTKDAENPGNPDNPGGGELKEPVPSLAKRAIKVTNQIDKYNLELDISSSLGSETNKAKLDVLLIMDRSGSMDNDRKMEKAQSAAKGLVDTLAANQNVDAQYALVSFSGVPDNDTTGAENNASIDIGASTGNYWTKNSETVKDKIDSLKTGGGTNYDAAFRKAETVLENKNTRKDAKQVVIFLTDGEPTCYVGDSTKSGGTMEYNDADKAREALTSLPSVEYFYSIGYGSAFQESEDFEDDTATAYKVLEALTEGGIVAIGRKQLNCLGANATTKELKRASKTDELKKVFADILSEITRIACKNVAVTDTLSDNVENVTGTTYQLKVTKKSDNTQMLLTTRRSWGTESTVWESGNMTELNGTKFTFSGDSNKTITCTYPAAYELNPDYTYTILINGVEVTEKAYQTYDPINGYPNTSDPATGTHATEKGFFSNVNENAKMTYKVKDVEKDPVFFPKPVVQINMNGEEDNGNPLYIEVQKTFKNLKEAEIPGGFKIELSDESKEVKQTLTLETANKAVHSDDGLTHTYTWKIENVGAGKYYVKEIGEGKDGYTVVRDANGTPIESEGGQIQIETKNPVYTIAEGKQINSCNNKSFSFDKQNFIAARLTDDKFFVWTRDTLSAGGRNAIIAMLNKDAQGNMSHATIATTDFFSKIEDLKKGIDYRGKIKFDEQSKKLIFEATKQWTHVYYGTYAVTEPVNAEIEITNTYTEDLIEIDLKKFGTTYDMNPLEGAKFSLFEGTLSGEKITWGNEAVTDYKDIPVTATGPKELKLPAGYYKLVETVAPTGYQILSDTQAIYFKVGNQKVVLTDNTGKELTEAQKDGLMWKLDAGNGFCISIKNEALYDLPSAGGTGIYWYLIGGVLLMLAAALILYRSKAKEVLRR